MCRLRCLCLGELYIFSLLLSPLLDLGAPGASRQRSLCPLYYVPAETRQPRSQIWQQREIGQELRRRSETSAFCWRAAR